MTVKTDKQPVISKIVVKMGKKEVPLTVDQARNLFKLLDEMFGERIKEVYHDHYYPYRPYWHWNYPTLYCGSSGNLTYTSADNAAINTTGGVVTCNLSTDS